VLNTAAYPKKNPDDVPHSTLSYISTADGRVRQNTILDSYGYGHFATDQESVFCGGHFFNGLADKSLLLKIDGQNVSAIEMPKGNLPKIHGEVLSLATGETAFGRKMMFTIPFSNYVAFLDLAQGHFDLVYLDIPLPTGVAFSPTRQDVVYVNARNKILYALQMTTEETQHWALADISSNGFGNGSHLSTFQKFD